MQQCKLYYKCSICVCLLPTITRTPAMSCINAFQKTVVTAVLKFVKIKVPTIYVISTSNGNISPKNEFVFENV